MSERVDLEQLKASLAKVRLSDATHADITIDGDDLAALIAELERLRRVEEAARAYMSQRSCPCHECQALRDAMEGRAND